MLGPAIKYINTREAERNKTLIVATHFMPNLRRSESVEVESPVSVLIKKALHARVGCRAITDDDADPVIDLLCVGFPSRPKSYWQTAFQTLRNRGVPEGCPRYGHVLIVDSTIVGVILLICVAVPDEDDVLRCNLSSWYVDPRFRIYASLMIKVALSHPGLTYTNTSSVAHTRETILSQGFAPYAEGQILAITAVGRRVPGLIIARIGPDHGDAGADDPMTKLLVDHARLGCISLRCTLDGEAFPFVFLRRHIPHVGLPCAQLIYCRDLASFWRFKGPLGRQLLKSGLLITMSEANEPVPGFLSRFFRGRSPAYFSGPHRPRLGDLAYGESVLFGP